MTATANSHRTVLIVGGGRGLGRTTAQYCARAGYPVVVASRSERELRETVDLVKAETPGARITLRTCDVTKDEQVRAMMDWTERESGPIYGMVCSAAVYGAIGLFDELSVDAWTAGFELNVLGPARCLHAVAPLMKRRGVGRIMLFAGGGEGAMTRFSSYVTSKGAIWRLTETVGAELAPFGVYLNAIAPGPVNTKFLDEVMALGPSVVGEEQYARFKKQHTEGGKPPEATGELVLYLLSGDAKELYGKTISANHDRYREIKDPLAVSKSDVFAMRRVVTPDGATRYSS